MDDASGRQGSDNYRDRDDGRRTMSIRERDSFRPHYEPHGNRESGRAFDGYDSYKPRGRDEFRPPAGTRQSPPPATAAQRDGKRKRDVSSNPSGNPPHNGKSSGNAPTQAQLPDNVPPGKAVSKAQPDLKEEVKKAGHYICIWAWWHFTKSQNEKKLRRVQGQIDQIKSTGSDFSSALDFLKQDKQTAEAEIKRCCSRIDTYGDKYYAAFMSISSLLKVDDGAKMDLSGHERTAPQQPTDIPASKFKELEVQTAELKEQLLRERKRNDALESKLDMLVRKVDESSKTDDAKPRKSPNPVMAVDGLREAELASIQAKCLGNASKMMDIKIKGLISKDELERRLLDFDQVMSRAETSAVGEQQTSSGPTPGIETAKALRSVAASMKALEQSMRSESSNIVGQLSLQIHEFKEVLSAYDGVVAKVMEEKKADATASSTADSNMGRLLIDGAKEDGGVSAGCTDEQVKEMVQNEFNNFTDEFVPSLMSGLQSQLEAGQQHREAIAEEAGKMAGTMLELRSELDELKAVMGSVNDWSTKLDKVEQSLAKAKEGLTWSNERIEMLDSALQTTKGMTKTEVEEVRFQLRNLQEWQNNFTTRPLYKDIVAHITETLPNSVWTQIRTLTGRINDLQALLENLGDASSAKRRRTEGPMGNGYDGSTAAS
ncbi:hypothetical protein CP533_1022 [Ophiocordyceps camponoti-saundersi (nom. inval.)]|nr:hypothetical protein CP533_1022 [Ophiocordyceps camponoti-saundersi (nom. inval.)]